jgi:hypothetical protein
MSKRKLIIRIILLVVIFSGFLNVRFTFGNASSSSQVIPVSAAEDLSIFLPLVKKPATASVFGAELQWFSEWKLDRANDANLYWIRNQTFSWANIEPNKTSPTPTYDYSSVDGGGLINASNHNLKVIATIRYAPSWAQQIPGVKCGPIKSSELARFAQFVQHTVQIYSAPPYNIKYWEFGNEPDTDPSLVPSDSVFGCWGDKNDSYYGGRYYAEMLKVAYPAVKSVDSSLKVLNGGLLLDCDPINGDNCDRLPGKFLQGILVNNGAPYFDMVSFHSYGYFMGNKIYDVDFEKWPNGGQIVGKINFIKNLLNSYGVNKPLFMTEAALVCNPKNPDCNPPSQQFLDLQADFVVSTYLRAWGHGIVGSIWYTLEESGWQESGLFSGTTPRPGYTALQFMTDELYLLDAKLSSEITQYPGLKGYAFTMVNKKVWVLWSPDGVTTKTISMPTGVTNIYDIQGNPLSTGPTTIDITHPTYFEFPP